MSPRGDDGEGLLADPLTGAPEPGAGGGYRRRAAALSGFMTVRPSACAARRRRAPAVTKVIPASRARRPCRRGHSGPVGKPVVRGTRIPVQLVLRRLAEGATFTDLPEQVPP